MRCLLLFLLFAAPLAAQPEIGLERDSTAIADGGNDSVSNSGTSPFNLTYTIRNDGTTDLNLTGAVTISVEDNCTVSVLTTPSTPVAPASTTTFILQVSPQSAAAFSFAVSIANDDADENPYDFTFNGNPAAPSKKSSGSSGGGDCSTGTHAGGALSVLIVSLLAALFRPKSLRRSRLDD